MLSYFFKFVKHKIYLDICGKKCIVEYQMEYKYQLDKIKELDISSGQSYRGDCIFCLNRNTLSVRNENGRLTWNCFHANCDAKGSLNVGSTVDDLQNFLHSKTNTPINGGNFLIPKEFVTVYGNNKARDYISKYELENTEARMMYDVKQDRIVFLIEDNGEVVGAIGRTLSESSLPKWYKYGTSSLPFMVGTNKYLGVLVEDCVSACKVAMANLTGIAIMGTRLPEEFIVPIADKVDRCFVCLDKDATEKSFKIRDTLSYHIPSYVEMIDKDLKYYSINELKKWGEELCTKIGS